MNTATPMFSNLSMTLPGNQATTGPTPNNIDLTLGNVENNNGHQHLYSSTTGLQPNHLGGCNNNVLIEATSGVVEQLTNNSGNNSTSNSIFGPVGSTTSSAIATGLNHCNTNQQTANSANAFGSPNGQQRSSHNVSDRLTMPDNFDPFRRSSPSLSSPSNSQQQQQIVNANGSTQQTNNIFSGSNGSGVNSNSFGLGTVLNTSSSPLRKSPTQNDHHNEATTNLEVEIGDNIVGAILGHKGSAIVEIQRISGANIQISKKGIFAPGTRNRIVTITGTPNSVTTAQYLIEQQLNEEEAKRRQNAPNALNNVLR